MRAVNFRMEKWLNVRDGFLFLQIEFEELITHYSATYLPSSVITLELKNPLSSSSTDVLPQVN